MPKLKKHRGLSKVLKVRPGKTIKRGKTGSRHNTGKKNADYNRKLRKGTILSESDYKRIKELLK